MSNTLTIHTAGVGRNARGPGGFAALVQDQQGKDIIAVTGGDPHATINQMELSAITDALRALEAVPSLTGAPVTVFSNPDGILEAFVHQLPQMWQSRLEGPHGQHRTGQGTLGRPALQDVRA